MVSDLPHDRRPSLLETVWNEFGGMVRGPLGCLLLILCIPVTLLALLVMLVIAWFRGRKLRRAFQDQVAAARTAAEAGPTLAYVAMFAGDESFSRDEAIHAAVPASAGRTAADLLEDAVARGWIAERAGDRLVVTSEGRTAAERLAGR